MWGRDISGKLCWLLCKDLNVILSLSIMYFTITAEILVHSLAKFLLSICRQTNEFIIYAMHQQVRADNLAICYRKKQMNVSFFVDNEFRHSVVKVQCVVCGSTRLSPHGFTATLTMFWQYSSSITGQMHEKLMSIC